ncbi:hypothetical protein ACO1O0_000122 [Amphichorda felina]
MKIMEARDFKARLVNRQEVIADRTNSPWVHSEQQYKIKLNEWGIHKNKRKGGDNRFGRGDQNIGGSSQTLWDANPVDILDGNLDSSLDLFGMADSNDPFNIHFHPDTYEPVNLGIPQNQGMSATSRTFHATGTKIRQPIHQAAQSGYLDMVKLLLERDPLCAGLAGTDGATAIWIASQQGHIEVVKLLLTYDGIDINAPIKESLRTPIHQAAQGGHTEVVRLLLSREAAADRVDKGNITPLWSAAQQGYHEIVQILIDAGGDKESASKNGCRRPLHQAAQNGHLEAVRILLEAGAKVDPHKDSYDDETPSPLWLAAQQGHCEIAKLLIRKGADTNFSIHPSKRFPIHQAAQNGYLDMVGLLLQNNADVNVREQDDWPPMMIAAQQNYTEIVDLLLRNGANVNAEEKDGATALWIASQQGHVQVMEKLLEYGAKSFATRSSLRRPIHQAAQNGHPEAVKLLLAKDPQDAHAEEKKGCTPLLLASQGETPGHLEVAMYLVQNGAQVVT